MPFRLMPFSWKAREIERLVRVMQITTVTKHGAIRFFCPSPLLALRAETLLLKEPDMLTWIDGIGDDAVFWDVGANVGVFTLYAATACNARVLAFEPSAANYDTLVRNIQINHLSGRVSAYCIALSGVTELGVLNLASSVPGSAMSQFGKSGESSRYWQGESGAEHGMVGFSVDEFITKFQPPFPSHLKMDVDGLEWPILQGAGATLRDPRLQSVMVELSVTNVEESAAAIRFLNDAGWSLLSRGERQGSETEAAANHLFVRTGPLIG